MPILPKEALLRKLDGLRPLVMPAIVVLVGVGAFGLGRLSTVPPQPALRILYPEAKAAVPVQNTTNTSAVANAAQVQSGPAEVGEGQGAVVASKSGTKYYLPTCSGVSRIKDENKVYFASAAQAQAAGYGPASNCPGL